MLCVLRACDHLHHAARVPRLRICANRNCIKVVCGQFSKKVKAGRIDCRPVRTSAQIFILFLENRGKSYGSYYMPTRVPVPFSTLLNKN